MTTQAITYPFEPKSTRFLAAGQFWPIRLSSGRYCCGRVMRLYPDVPQWKRRGFLAGLMDWSDVEPPTSETLAGHKTCAQGFVTIKTIQETGSAITGIRDLALDGIEPDLFIIYSGREAVCMLTDGYHHIRRATDDERARLSAFAGWTCDHIKRLAEKHYAHEAA